MSELSETIKAKSDQLNADDLQCGPITVEVLDVEVDKANKEQPIKITIDGDHMPYFPCKSMRRVLIAAWGDDGSEGKSWIGNRMTLFREPNVKYAGLMCGGIRISHLAGLKNKEESFVITIRKGAKGAYLVKRLDEDKTAIKLAPPALTEAEQVSVREVTADIEQCDSMESLKAIGFILKNKSEALRNALRPAYDKRKKELEA